MPDLPLTVLMSEMLMTPLTVTSVRKVVALGTVPLWAFVWLISEMLTTAFSVVSPSSTPIGMETVPGPLPKPSLTFKSLMVIL